MYNAGSRQRNHKRSGPPLPPAGPRHPPKDPNSLAQCDQEATPACIRALYDFAAPFSREPVCANNSMGIFEEESLCKLSVVHRLFLSLLREQIIIRVLTT
jgi:hypothetical protein